MNKMTCENLDAYLLGHLEAKIETQFESHLEECAACQQQAKLQTQIDLLSSQETEIPVDELRLSQILETLDATFEKEVGPKYRGPVSLSLAIAAVLLIGISLALSYAWVNTAPSELAPDHKIAVQPQQPVSTPATTKEETVEESEFVSPQLISHDKNHLAVVIETDDPDFSVILFYPTVQTQITATNENR
ncbi:MAG: anti-sigma factor family protein [Pirellulales bacterium]